jgi:N-acetylglucosamine malate deacetylase 1
MTQRAFAVAAHPDDIEFMMAGTLILLKQAGYEIHVMTVGNGSCGSEQVDAATIARIRRQECIDAAALIGAVWHESLCPDLEIFYNKELLQRLAAVMRAVAPTILLTHPPQDYMEDHMNTCRLALTAAFARGMPNFPVLPPRPPIDTPVTVYHALPYGLRDPLNRQVHPEFFVDISSVLDEKRQMLARHRSQKDWLDASQGIDSYLNHMETMSREVGHLSGRFDLAEGWTRHLPFGYCAEHANPLVDTLAGLTWQHTPAAY